MSFATTKDKQALLRTTFVRLTPGRCVDAVLSLVSGVYQCAWTLPMDRVERNGTALTKDTAIPSTNDHWWYDEVNSLLYVKLASAPSDTANVVVAFYYLFVTSGMAIIANEDPLDTTKPLRQWEPRLAQEPHFVQSVSNVIEGIFALQGAQLQLNNADLWFDQWFSDNDSWNEKDVVAWLGIRATEADTPDFQRVYSGKIKSATLDRHFCQLTIIDAFSRLNQPALMGDSLDEVVVQLKASSYPSADPAFANMAVPLHIGTYSRFLTKFYAPNPATNNRVLDYTSLPRAFSSSYANASTTNNRTWTLGRCLPAGFKTWTLPAPDNGITASGAGGNGYLEYRYLSGTFATFTCEVGDRVKIVDTGVTYYGRVSVVDALGSRITLCLDTNSVPGGGAPTITTYSDPALVLVDKSGNEFHLAPVRDYTSSLTATSGGNKICTVAIVNNFEANLTVANGYPVAFSGALDPSSCKIYYRLRLDNSTANHADVLNTILTAAGMSVNSSSFATAKAALAINYYASIPYFDETAPKTYIQYTEDLLSSSLGILALDSASLAQYLLIAAPTSADTTDDNVALTTSDSIVVEYQDIVTQLVAYNPHNSSMETLNGHGTLSAFKTPAESRTNLKSKYLHGINNAVELRHVLETITDRIDQIMNAKSNRRATYTFDVATKYLDAALGQDLIRKSSLLLGVDTQRTVKTFSLDLGADHATVQAVDLLGVT